MDLPREWTAFGGASLTLMGVELFAGARRHAEDALAWQRQRRRAVGAPEAPDEGRSPVFAYRAGGAVVILLGAVLAAAAAAGRALSSTYFVLGDARVLGACLTALGLGFAALKLSRVAARGPRFLAEDPLATGPGRTFGERVAGAATWGLYALWAGFGLRLFSAASR